MSDGATRVERSLYVGFDNRPLGQMQAISGFGVFDMTIVAWDANAVYADSLPMTFRVQTIPGPGPTALFAVAGGAITRRRRRGR